MAIISLSVTCVHICIYTVCARYVPTTCVHAMLLNHLESEYLGVFDVAFDCREGHAPAYLSISTRGAKVP